MLTTDLTPHLALITGATGGIGRATSLALAKIGCSLALHYHAAAEDATTLVADLIENYGIRAAAFQADLANYDDVRALHASVLSTFSRGPTILFNNAGTTKNVSRATDISQISIDVFEQTWRVNCGAAFLLTQLCVPAMVEQGWGRVLFCSSVAGFTGGVVGGHYASSKSALHGLIHWLAATYAKKGITVNGVAPALISKTKMLPGGDEELAKKIPLGFLGEPEEVAETVVWMVKTGYVTNKVVGVDGGMFVQ